MSWSIFFIGTPEKVVEALEKESEKMSGYSKIEYDDALPNLIGLVKQNFDKDATHKGLIKLNANGHGYNNGTEDINRVCNVSIEGSYGVLL